MRIRRSWKTSIGGTLTAAGAALMGAPHIVGMTDEEKHYAVLLGFILTVAGPVLHGFAGRDNDKSDQEVGLRPEIKPPPNQENK